jgi:hypothetical protein
MKFLICSALLILYSCGTPEFKRGGENPPYQTSGVEQFFLPQLPTWANYSPSAACFKKSVIHYLDFTKLKEIHQLSYQQMVELQAQYNERLENYFRSTAVRFLKPVEESAFFGNSLEQVRGGVRSLKLPNITEVEVIWLESFNVNDLKKMAKRGRFDAKLPVLFSSCHTRQSLAQWLAQEKLDEIGFYLLTAEWLSPFSKEGKANPGLMLEIGELLGKNIKYTFISESNKTTTEIILP